MFFNVMFVLFMLFAVSVVSVVFVVSMVFVVSVVSVVSMDFTFLRHPITHLLMKVVFEIFSAAIRCNVSRKQAM